MQLSEFSATVAAILKHKQMNTLPLPTQSKLASEQLSELNAQYEFEAMLTQLNVIAAVHDISL